MEWTPGIWNSFSASGDCGYLFTCERLIEKDLLNGKIGWHGINLRQFGLGVVSFKSDVLRDIILKKDECFGRIKVIRVSIFFEMTPDLD